MGTTKTSVNIVVIFILICDSPIEVIYAIGRKGLLYFTVWVITKILYIVNINIV